MKKLDNFLKVVFVYFASSYVCFFLMTNFGIDFANRIFGVSLIAHPFIYINIFLLLIHIVSANITFAFLKLSKDLLLPFIGIVIAGTFAFYALGFYPIEAFNYIMINGFVFFLECYAITFIYVFYKAYINVSEDK